MSPPNWLVNANHQFIPIINKSEWMENVLVENTQNIFLKQFTFLSFL